MHCAHVVFRVAPITFSVEISDPQFVRQPELDSRDRARRLATHKLKPTSRTLMVEKNPTDAKEPVCLAIISGQVMTRDFADPVRAARLKRGGLLLRHFVDVPKHLARSREVKTTLRPQFPERRQHVVRAVDVRTHRRKAVSKTFRYETLGREVVTLVKIMFAEHVENTGITLETGGVQR